MKLLVGLGNPGSSYQQTRHNIGWLTLDAFASAHAAGTAFHELPKFQSAIIEFAHKGEKMLLAKPLTFMNLSGEAVIRLQQFYKIPLEHILLIQDEMDYAFGTLGFIAQGGNAGHNGVASIQERLSTQNIARLRCGIGRPTTPQLKERYVLEPFSAEEVAQLPTFLHDAAQACQTWVEEGIQRSMNLWNRKPSPTS